MGRPVTRRSKLGEWVDAQGWTRQQLADELGITVGSAVRLCNGVRRPSLELAIKIERLTGGAIPVTCWIEVPAHTKD
jgi:transcriptional regulator with XRE-family HTH domain